MERTTTEMDSILFGAVHRLAAEQGREDSEVLEDAVSYYLLALGSFSASEVSQECRALARERLTELAGSGDLGQEEAQMLAERAVRRARDEAPDRDQELSKLSPQEIRTRLGDRSAGETNGAS
jgi:hypothetical protein